MSRLLIVAVFLAVVGLALAKVQRDNCDNSCTWAYDDECDEGFLCADGTDCDDCEETVLGCDDSCESANDGYCDVEIGNTDGCFPGTDCTDCDGFFRKRTYGVKGRFLAKSKAAYKPAKNIASSKNKIIALKKYLAQIKK